MSEQHGYLKGLLANLRKVRETAAISTEKLEEQLILGPGWIKRFEEGKSIPSIDMLLAILHKCGSSIGKLIEGLDAPDAAEVERYIFAEQKNDNILIHFRYDNFDASYELTNAHLHQFESVLKRLRDGLSLLTHTKGELSQSLKADAVAQAFLEAVRVWPHANPSDLWWFIVYRAYCDPYNHPASWARLNLDQSWKRTGGWALEKVLVSHYGNFLQQHGIKVLIVDSATKRRIIKDIKVRERLEADKIDVVLLGGEEERFFGVVHVKASFAERRTDDVPMSAALSRAGYTSPLWTMDCKSTPRENPFNKGELGINSGPISAKRRDIEEEGYFTGCFSYNGNTIESNPHLPAERRVYVCDFKNPDDSFSQFLVRRWQIFRQRASPKKR